MSKSYVKDNNGKTTHIRETSDDGKRSYLYEADSSIAGHFLTDGKGKLVELADHKPTGETKAYEPATGIIGTLLFGGKGKPK